MTVKASFYNYNLHTSVWWAYHYNNIQHQTVTWIFSSVITLLVSTKASHELLSWKVIGQSILLLNINTFLLSLCRGSIWWIISSNMPGLKWLPPECKIGILKTRSGFWKKNTFLKKKYQYLHIINVLMIFSTDGDQIMMNNEFTIGIFNDINTNLNNILPVKYTCILML